MQSFIRNQQRRHIKGPNVLLSDFGLSNSRSLRLATFIAMSMAIAFVIVSKDVNCQERLVVEGRQQKESGDDLTATINYLENVDKVLSQLSRPRFGRSDYKQQPRIGSGGHYAIGSYAVPQSLAELLSPNSKQFAQLLAQRMAAANSNNY